MNAAAPDLDVVAARSGARTKARDTNAHADASLAHVEAKRPSLHTLSNIKPLNHIMA